MIALADLSGASAIAIVDLKQADAEAAAKDLVDWFGEFEVGSILQS